jgi:hypothetical protein
VLVRIGVVILILEELRFAPIRYWNNLAGIRNNCSAYSKNYSDMDAKKTSRDLNISS